MIPLCAWQNIECIIKIATVLYFILTVAYNSYSTIKLKIKNDIKDIKKLRKILKSLLK